MGKVKAVKVFVLLKWNAWKLIPGTAQYSLMIVLGQATEGEDSS